MPYIYTEFGMIYIYPNSVYLKCIILLKNDTVLERKNVFVKDILITLWQNLNNKDQCAKLKS